MNTNLSFTYLSKRSTWNIHMLLFLTTDSVFYSNLLNLFQKDGGGGVQLQCLIKRPAHTNHSINAISENII